MTTTADVPTPLGAARLHVTEPDPSVAAGPAGTLVLGHGAGGGVAAPDLRAAAAAALAGGWRVVLVEQPWRVAGKRVAPAPERLDVGWTAALEGMRALLPDAASSATAGAGGRLVVGGRSAGARVAARTALGLGAVAACCLAFPLHPPGRPERTRAPELAACGVPALVVQGTRDPFGSAEAIVALALQGVTVRPVDGDHGMRGAAVAAAVGDAVGAFLRELS